MSTKTATNVGAAVLAALYGLAPGTLANWRAQRKGPAFKKRGAVRNGRVTYPLGSARAWFKRNGYPLASTSDGGR